MNREQYLRYLLLSDEKKAERDALAPGEYFQLANELIGLNELNPSRVQLVMENGQIVQKGAGFAIPVDDSGIPPKPGKYFTIPNSTSAKKGKYFTIPNDSEPVVKGQHFTIPKETSGRIEEW